MFAAIVSKMEQEPCQAGTPVGLSQWVISHDGSLNMLRTHDSAISTSRALTFGRSLRLGVVVAFALLAAHVPGSLAQTPVATPVTEDTPHPAHIHTGTCAELGDVVVPLEDVAGEAGEWVGPESAIPVETSRTVVPLPLDEIIAGGHAINVHQSVDEIGVYIACGDIGGVLETDEDGRTHLIIGLAELNGSGVSGSAWLGADGDETEVVITLTDPN
jgi:hypothetical protein